MNNTNKLSIGNKISLIHRSGANYLTTNYLKYHIGFGQYQYLINLYLKDGLSHDELTHLVKMDKATTTRSVNKLLSLNLVRIEQNPLDKRKYCIYLTDYAKSIKDDIFSTATDWEEKLLSDLSESEIILLENILIKISNNI